MWHVYLDIYRIMQLAPKYWWRWWRTPIGWVGNWTRNGMAYMRYCWEVVKIKIPAEIYTGQAAEKALQRCFAQGVPSPLQAPSSLQTPSSLTCQASSTSEDCILENVAAEMTLKRQLPTQPQETKKQRKNWPKLSDKNIAIVEEGKMLNDEHIHFATEFLH